MNCRIDSPHVATVEEGPSWFVAARPSAVIRLGAQPWDVEPKRLNQWPSLRKHAQRRALGGCPGYEIDKQPPLGRSWEAIVPIFPSTWIGRLERECPGWRFWYGGPHEEKAWDAERRGAPQHQLSAATPALLRKACRRTQQSPRRR